MIHVLVWNEYVHEKEMPEVAAIYPKGIHGAIADFLRCDDIEVETATLDDENCGITPERLQKTDVLIWWGHAAHSRVPDEIAYMVRDAVMDGMGFIALHSAHHSKPFRYLLGTSCNLTWRESGDSEILWVTEPAHPITRGIDRYFRVLFAEIGLFSHISDKLFLCHRLYSSFCTRLQLCTNYPLVWAQSVIASRVMWVY